MYTATIPAAVMKKKFEITSVASSMPDRMSKTFDVDTMNPFFTSYVGSITPDHSRKNGSITAANVHSTTSHKRSAIVRMAASCMRHAHTTIGVRMNGPEIRVNMRATSIVITSVTGMLE